MIEAGYESLARSKDGGYELSVLAEGIYCAACIGKIEGALRDDPHIQKARVNFTTRTVSIQWTGTSEKANGYVKTIEDLGYHVHPYDPQTENEQGFREERFLLLCLGVAGFAMGNIMLLSLGLWMTNTETMGMATRDFLHLISALIALPAIAFAGRPFFRSALNALTHKRTNMDVPISVALLLACGMSVFEVLNNGEHIYFDSAIMLMFFLLVGRYLDFRARKQARSAASDLASTLTGFASVIEKRKIKRIPIRELQPNMMIKVAMGEKIPADGAVTKGQSNLDMSLVTGETQPQPVAKGTSVYAGTLNLSAPLTIKVSKQSDDTMLAGIIRLIQQAEQGQARYVRIADKAAQFYTPVVHTMAILAFLGWFFIGGLPWQDSLMIAITVLIITCPCALGLAVPVVQVLATGKLIKQGIIIKSGDALERLAQIDMIMLDKTGTITLGKPQLIGNYNHEHLRIASSLAQHSQHPLTHAITAEDHIELSHIKEHPGRGMQGVHDNKIIKLGSRTWCGDATAPPSEYMEMWLNIEEQQPVVFNFMDELRIDAPYVIDQFKLQKIPAIIASGDRISVVQSVAKECGIDISYGEQKPDNKYAILQDLNNQDHKVLMVGDGLNDAPVLAGAHVSIAPGTAIDIAQNSADIIFMGDVLDPILTTYKTAKTAQTLVKQNFALAVGYNVLAIPIALSGLVTPLIAALAMSGSSLIVILNAFRLRLKP